ncbi:S1C family serine protease [Desertibaculum subflavum]|uniref:S1C family serine protease n=1 Tax=Desertibaculum subflavum TaxID=2268458 RepID=UPI000E66E4DC
MARESEGKYVNGHRPFGAADLFRPGVVPEARPKPGDYAFDVERTVSRVYGLRSEVPEDAFTARTLGTEREGNAIPISRDGLVLTIGYLVSEASRVILAASNGGIAEAHVVAYDFETGFGLVRTATPLGLEPFEFGTAATLLPGDPVIVAGNGGMKQALAARVRAKHEFAGYWEYLLEEAIFTEPAHPNWGGTALIDKNGKLVGVGSLHLAESDKPGNMFVPIDLLPPILPALTRHGDAGRQSRPWLGLYLTEAEKHLVVAGVAPAGPATTAEIKVGDVIVALDGVPVQGLAPFYRLLWGRGRAGISVRLAVFREGKLREISVETADRSWFMKRPQAQ